MNFGEIVDVDFTPAFANQTMTIQYLNGSHWKDLQSFSGNPVGFTETSQGIDSSWARQGTNVIRVTSGTCASATVVFLVQPDPSGPRLDLAVYSVLAVTLALFILLGGKLGWKRFALVGAVVYVAISPWTGQRYDIYFLLSSGIRVLQHINPFDAGTPPLYPGALKWAYPPLYPVYSAFSFVIFQGLTGAPLPSVAALTYPGWLTAVYSVYQAYVPAGLPVLVFLLKVPMVASAIATGFLLKKMTGSESSAVLWVANPLVVLVAAVWGQLDPIATLLAVASLYYFDKGMQYKAYFLASVGVAVKVWPILMIPIFLVVSLRRMGLSALKPFAAVLPASLVSIGIYALYENPIQALYILAYARGVPTFAGAFSVNGLTWQQVLFVIGAPPVPIFLFVAIPIYVAILAWAYWRKETDVTKLLIVFILILFLTYNYVNPQYFYWILPLLILKGRRLETAAFTAMPLAYIAFAYNIFYFISPALLPNLFGFSASIAEQLKVSYFYNSPVVFALVAGVLLTLAYIATLVREMKARAANV
jgi:Gpi18-like mannosyltransferase